MGILVNMMLFIIIFTSMPISRDLGILVNMMLFIITRVYTSVSTKEIGEIP